MLVISGEVDRRGWSGRGLHDEQSKSKSKDISKIKY